MFALKFNTFDRASRPYLWNCRVQVLWVWKNYFFSIDYYEQFGWNYIKKTTVQFLLDVFHGTRDTMEERFDWNNSSECTQQILFNSCSFVVFSLMLIRTRIIATFSWFYAGAYQAKALIKIKPHVSAKHLRCITETNKPALDRDFPFSFWQTHDYDNSEPAGFGWAKFKNHCSRCSVTKFRL